MCGGPERLKTSPFPSPFQSPFTSQDNINNSSSLPSFDMKHLTIETGDNFSSLLELAANNDADGFKRSVDEEPSAVDEIGLWYGRKKGSNRMVLEPRTPLMVAATYGSIEVLRLILSLSSVDVNRCCGPDKTTALHCAASSGLANAVDAVKLLLSAGADANLVDANGHRPADVISVPPKLCEFKLALEELLGGSGGDPRCILRVSTSPSSSNSPPLSLSPVEGGSPSSDDSSASPTAGKFHDHPPVSPAAAASEKKEYPVDPSLPDIKNSIYATDEFRMFSFKIRPCSRAYSHDWTECPFVHPGENARRRDPRKYHYSCVPCPDFRKGACRRGDMCEYAHGVFECWLHPAQYRTRLCKDGPSCTRRVCFFAHTNEELRPLYVSTGSTVPSPRSSASAAMEMAAAMSLLQGSPSSVSVMSPTPFTPTMSPSSNGGGHSSLAWPQPNVPVLHLPGSNLQSSRLRTSLSARDMAVDELLMLSELEPQQQQQQQQQQQSLLSPIKTNGVFSPKAVDPQQALLQASLGVASSPGRMSPRGMEPVSPMSSRLAALAQREKLQQQLRSLGSSNSVPSMVGSPANSSWSKWGSPSGKVDWGVNGDELGRYRSSSSFELGGSTSGEEPDVSWVHSLVNPPELKDKHEANTSASNGGGAADASNSSTQMDGSDHAVLGAWLEQMQLDQLVA
ncbi:zinc finger CCCH domain-containing protein 24-like isoform X2 [Phoenix dactylifera]|uniref:Zinc finger CCCH domain-containing protein 24-like isoform X2 n=1 Tax=Phoenix dactylifera TaxID=42345 RepID=A0A8B8ZCB9_PHODC|nr:zinc finger CCCH domain-containing protein 24-like isoform X2 [Phoenix dactylifera]